MLMVKKKNMEQEASGAVINKTVLLRTQNWIILRVLTGSEEGLERSLRTEKRNNND